MPSPSFEAQEQQLPDDIAALGAWAIAPVLFEDPEFRALYDKEYEAGLMDNEAARNIDALRGRVRTLMSELLPGMGALGESASPLPLFEEDSLNSREGMGSHLLELLKENPGIYAKYFGHILECGMKLNGQPPVKKHKKCRWGVELPASEDL